MRVSIVAVRVSESPELPTTDYWRGVMRRSRKAAGLTQGGLAARVGVSQAVISDLETGAQSGSTVIMAVCKVLGITPPHVMVEDVDDERWLRVGRMLRRRNRGKYERWLTMLLAEMDDTPDSDDKAH
jgi:transcriptional regulator with XRE-family HTH domain